MKLQGESRAPVVGDGSGAGTGVRRVPSSGLLCPAGLVGWTRQDSESAGMAGQAGWWGLICGADRGLVPAAKAGLQSVR